MEMKVKKFKVDNIQNPKDIKTIRADIQAMNGVHTVRVDDVANTVTVEFDNNVNEKDIESKLQ